MSADEEGKLLIGYDKLIFTEQIIGDDEKGLLGIAKKLSEKQELKSNEKENMTFLYQALLATKGTIKESDTRKRFENGEYERSRFAFLKEFNINMKECKRKFKEQVEEKCKGDTTFDRVKDLSKSLPELEKLNLSFTSGKVDDDEDEDDVSNRSQEEDKDNITEELKKIVTGLEKKEEDVPAGKGEGGEIPEVETDKKEKETFSYIPPPEGLGFGENSKIEINKKIASKFYDFDYSSGFKLTGDVGGISECQEEQIEKKLKQINCDNKIVFEKKYKKNVEEFFQRIKLSEKEDYQKIYKSLFECINLENFLDIIDTATKQHIYIIEMLEILYCKVFHYIEKDYTKIRRNTIQGLKNMIEKMVDPFIKTLNEYDGADEPGEEIAEMKKGLNKLGKDVGKFQFLLENGQCNAGDDDEGGDENEGDENEGDDDEGDDDEGDDDEGDVDGVTFFSVINALLDKENGEDEKEKKEKKNKFSKTLKNIIENNNLEEEGYLRINDVDLDPKETTKIIRNDMKEFKKNMFTKYNQICSQKVMYFNLQLLKIMSGYSKKTERFLNAIHINGIEEEEKISKTIDLYEKIASLKDFEIKIKETYEKGEMTLKKINEITKGDTKGKELFEEASRYRETIDKLYKGLIKDLQKVKLLNDDKTENIKEMVDQVNSLQKSLQVEKAKLDSMKNRYLGIRSRDKDVDVGSQDYLDQKDKVRVLKQRIKEKEIEINNALPKRNNVSKINYILNHFDKIKEYFPAIADLLNSYGTGYKFQHRLNIEDGSYNTDQELKSKRIIQDALYTRDKYFLMIRDKIGKLEYYVNRIKYIINDEIIKVTAQGYKDYFTELYIATVEVRLEGLEKEKLGKILDEIVLESGVPYEKNVGERYDYEKIEYDPKALVLAIRKKYTKIQTQQEENLQDVSHDVSTGGKGGGGEEAKAKPTANFLNKAVSAGKIVGKKAVSSGKVVGTFIDRALIPSFLKDHVLKSIEFSLKLGDYNKAYYKLKAKEEDINKHYDKLKAITGKMQNIACQQWNGNMLTFEQELMGNLINADFCSESKKDLGNLLDGVGRIYKFSINRAFNDCETIFVDEKLELIKSERKTMTKVWGGIGIVLDKLKKILGAITYSVVNVGPLIVDLFKWLKKNTWALYLVSERLLKFLWNYFIKYSRPGIFVKNSMKKTWRGLKNFTRFMGKGVNALFEGIATAVTNLGRGIVGLLNNPFSKSKKGDKNTSFLRGLFQGTRNEREPGETDGTSGSKDSREDTKKKKGLLEDDKKINKNIDGILGYLEYMEGNLDIMDPYQEELCDKIAHLKHIIEENRLTTSYFFSIKIKEENLVNLQNIASKESLYAEIVRDYLKMKGSQEHIDRLDEYIQKLPQREGGEIEEQASLVGKITSIEDELANSVLGDDKDKASFRNIVRTTKRTDVNFKYVSAKENIRNAQDQRLADILSGSAGFFGILGSKAKGFFEEISSLPDQMYIDNGFKPEEVAKMKMIDKKGTLHQKLKDIFTSPVDRVKKISYMSETLSSLTFSDEKDIGLKMMERNKREPEKKDIQDEIIKEIVGALMVVMLDDSNFDIKKEFDYSSRNLKQKLKAKKKRLSELEEKQRTEPLVEQIEEYEKQIQELNETFGKMTGEEQAKNEDRIKQEIKSLEVGRDREKEALERVKKNIKKDEEIEEMQSLQQDISKLEVELEANQGGDLEDEDDDEPHMYDHFEQKYGNQVKSIVEFSFMKASEHLKELEERKKEFRESGESMGKSVSSFFDGFGRSAATAAAAMEESLKTTKGLKGSRSNFLTGRLESLEVAKAGIAARIEEMTRGSDESAEDFARRKATSQQELKNIQEQIEMGQKEKREQQLRLENAQATTTDSGTSPFSNIDPIPEEDDKPPGVLRNKGAMVQIDESRNQVRLIEDQSIKEPRYVDSYNQTIERFKKTNASYDSNSERYQSIMSLSREYLTLNPRNRRFSDDSVKRYYDEVKWMSDKFNTYKTDIQVNIDTLESILNVYSSKNSMNKRGGAATSNILTIQKVSDRLSEIKRKRSDLEVKITNLEDILDQLNRIFNIGKKKEERELEKYKDIIKEFNNIRGNDRNYSNYEFKRICSIMDKGFGRTSKLDGNNSSHKEIINGLKKISGECKDVKRKQKEKEEEDKKKIEEGKRKKKEEEKINNERKKLEQERKKFQESQAQKPGQRPPQQPQPGQRPLQPGQQPGQPPGQPPGQQPGQKPSQPTKPGEVPKGDSKALQMVDKKPNVLNMGKDLDGKIADITKRQGLNLVMPPKGKLKELSRVMGNDKLLDIIRNKNFSEFSDKEVKDVDIVRDRFNKFVNDYYQLLDMFYDYKKNKERGEKEDVLMILKQEKQIEQLKNIVLEYKTNLEKFKNACEIKNDELQIENIKESGKKEKEFKDVFGYMQGLFKEELKEEKKATKENTKILKEENELQKEKILLLEDKKTEDKKKKRTPKKKNDKSSEKKKDRTPKKKNDKIPKKKNDRTPKKKKDKTPKKKKDRTPKKR